jgi:hypothetical protein
LLEANIRIQTDSEAIDIVIKKAKAAEGSHPDVAGAAAAAGVDGASIAAAKTDAAPASKTYSGAPQKALDLRRHRRRYHSVSEKLAPERLILRDNLYCRHSGALPLQSFDRDLDRKTVCSVAEVSVSEDDLDDRMNRMRAWLDHQRFQPSSFRLQRWVIGRSSVLFKTAEEAAAFASEFGGSLPSLAATDVAIA